MKKTLSEKILSNKAGRDVLPGEFLLLEVDIALGNDITAPLAIERFYKYGGKKVYDQKQIVLIPDHFVPNKDIASAEQANILRKFAREQRIKKYFEVGRMGIEHVLLPEEGIVKSGDLIIGADSHTCTYGALGAFATGVGSTDLAGVFLTGKAWFKVPESIRIFIQGKFRPFVSGKDLILKIISTLGVDGARYKSLEFAGPGLKNISMDSRFTICNMAIEAGAKVGLFPVDQITIDYEAERGIMPDCLNADPDAHYQKELKIDLKDLKSQVAYPFLPSNTKNIDETKKEKLAVDQVVIGSCTNGRIEDLREAASIMKNKKVDPNIRCIIIPGTQKIYKQAIKEGLVEIFIDAQCVFSTPTCGPCLGGHMGILASGERALATTNRNFIGRMGDPKSEVFLASPAIAAATAIKGYITSPVDL